MISLRRELKELGIRPRKRWGQHFVVDPGVLDQIIKWAHLERDDVVVEIGPGSGNLTAPLARSARKVYAIEIDPRLAEVVKGKFAPHPEVEIILADALQVDFAPWFEKWQRRMKVVANLPYEISTPMLFRLLRERKFFSLFVLMLQREVARRVVAQPGTKDYGPLALWSQLYTRPRIAFLVRPQAFHPPPKVDSAVIAFEVLPRPSVEVEDEALLGRTIRSVFTYRRKTLANSLHLGNFSHVPMTRISGLIQTAGISPGVRGETLTLEQFRDLSRVLTAISHPD